MINQKELFCENIRQCEKSMYTLAYGIVKNEHDAADVIQESILKAYCNYNGLRDSKKFKQWILQIVHNTAIDFIHKRFDAVDIEIQEPVQAVNAIDKESKLVIWDAIQKVKLPYRTVLILFYYEEYSISQIANIMSISVVNVKQQLSRGRKMLAKNLDKEDFLQ